MSPLSNPELANSIITEVRGLRHDLALLIKLGFVGAVLLAFAVLGIFFSWKSAHSSEKSAAANNELLSLIKPLVTPEKLDDAKLRQACLVLLAADKPVDERCGKIRDELVRIQSGH